MSSITVILNGYRRPQNLPLQVEAIKNQSVDCSWMGSIHGQDHISAIETISKFDYRFLTSQLNTWMRHPYEFNKCTHVNLPSEDKLVELSKCRSSLSFNMIYMSPSSVDNGTFDVFDHFNEGVMPQFKVRTHEITSSKSLMLVKKDPWNLVEDFYTPEEEFIYFESFEELEEIIRDVRDNFDKYTDIIDNAYEKSKSYTVEKIFEYIKTNDSSLVTWRNKHV
jgi:spore maturation protein CgeB